MSIYGILDADLEIGGPKYPFLESGPNGCNYHLRLVEAAEWQSKKNKQWRARFVVDVLASSGEGATPEGARCTILLLESEWNYHIRDLQNLGTVVTGDRLTEKTCKELLTEGKFNGAEFLAHVGKNEKGFPLYTYRAHTAESEEAPAELAPAVKQEEEEEEAAVPLQEEPPAPKPTAKGKRGARK